MRIYVASSWRNPWQPDVVDFLRASGHIVYDFRNPRPGESGFSWGDIAEGWKDWSPEEYRSGLEHKIACDGFASDMDALRRADACVLVLPCGNSAHLELGFAVGACKRTAVLFPQRHPGTAKTPDDFDTDPDISINLHRKFEPELMARMADAVLIGKGELSLWITKQSS